MPNELSSEKSPFLLRHANDLVDWKPWGEKVFRLARETDRFIYLSVGNTASRWSSTMQRECFTDPEVADLMNSTCVCILVDADERPDITGIFMDVCQIQNGGAGLPLNVLLTSDGDPFFAATWLPKRSMANVPGLVDVLPRSKWLWITQKENVYRSAESLIEEIRRYAIPAHGGIPGSLQARAAFKELKKEFDDVWGGFNFGGNPKTVAGPKLMFLLDYAERTRSVQATDMIKKTLRKMWLGGIHDHVGGGFFESAIDDRWIVPRFNKTLVDQALLLYVAGAVKDNLVAGDIAGFMLRDLVSPESGFYCSIDAADESYYLWTEEELRTIIPTNDFAVFGHAFSVMRGGNFRHEITGVTTGQNVLYMNEGMEALATRFYSKTDLVDEKISAIRKTLFEAREKRSQVYVNDQIILAYNGIAIAALAFAGKSLDKNDWILAAERALIFCQKTFPDPKGNWRRRYREKEASVEVQFCDLICLAWGALEVHFATSVEGVKKDGKDSWLTFAEALVTKAEELFTVQEKGRSYGFFATDGKDEKVIRRKLGADSGIPGENGVAVRVFTMLSKAFSPNRKKTKEENVKHDDTAVKEAESKVKKYRALAKETAAAFTHPAAKTPSSFSFLLGSSLKI